MLILRIYRQNNILHLYDAADEKDDICTLHGDPVADENGFYHLEHNPIPKWLIYEEGEMADISGGEVAAVNVPVCFDDSMNKTLYFQPICSATSCLTLNDIPVVFDLKK